MPVGGQTAVALAFRKASRSPSLPAMKYAAPSASKSPRRLSKRDWIIQSPICQDGGARALILCKDSAGRGEVTPGPGPLPYKGSGAMPEWRRRNGPAGSRRRGGDVLQEPLEPRISGVACRQPPHVAAGFTLERGAAAGVARGLAHQRRSEHPVRLHPGEVAVARDAAQVADAELGAPRPEADQLRHEAREGAGPRQAVLVDAEPQVAVDARRVHLQHAPVGVPHRLAVFRCAPRVALQVVLARAVTERGGEPELTRGARGLRGRARERDG